MLAEAQGWLRNHHREARLYVYGQDYNKRAYATAASDMLMKQVDHNGGSGSRGDNVRLGDSLIEDRFAGETFDYFLTNPPSASIGSGSRARSGASTSSRASRAASGPGCRG